MTPDAVLEFWFSEPMASHWFSSTPEIDADIRTRFEPLWQQAGSGELDRWKASPEGALALVIILDQLPLNMFRGEAKSFATEQQAVNVTLDAVEKGFDRHFEESKKAFLYMPLMHSESDEDQKMSVRLFEAAGLQENLRFARHHQALIERFGRFPHRNAILGRESTPDELDYLASKEAFLG